MLSLTDKADDRVARVHMMQMPAGLVGLIHPNHGGFTSDAAFSCLSTTTTTARVLLIIISYFFVLSLLQIARYITFSQSVSGRLTLPAEKACDWNALTFVKHYLSSCATCPLVGSMSRRQSPRSRSLSLLG